MPNKLLFTKLKFIFLNKTDFSHAFNCEHSKHFMKEEHIGLCISLFLKNWTETRHPSNQVVKPIFFLFSLSLTMMKMDRITIPQRQKIIKTYCKNGDDRWTAICRTKFSSAIKHISHSVSMLINKIVIFGILRILK